jgi:DNA-binding FadR family transcriptional regulator
MEARMPDGDFQDGVPPILNQIVTLIRQRGYEPGDRVPSEREFAERLSVGRAQVREAMTMLEGMRYLDKRRGSGVFLCRDSDTTSLEALVLFAQIDVPVDPKINDQCIEVRRIIEVQAIRLACERRSDADLAALSAVLATFRDEDGFAEDAAEYDYAFHLTLLKATRNDILVRVVNPFYLMSGVRRS